LFPPPHAAFAVSDREVDVPEAVDLREVHATCCRAKRTRARAAGVPRITADRCFSDAHRTRAQNVTM
jgi:hypothetical protein